jgi:hypothetical protein
MISTQPTVPKVKERPPYWLGLLCLIPMVGAFVGVGLFLYGLIKYKDKWMMLIGIGGILFTVAIYGSLFWSMKHSSSSRSGFAELSVVNLNNIVRHLEFHKLQYGDYPEQLTTLRDEDKFAPLGDPIQGSKFRDNTDYEYRLFGNKYTVYSRGEDGKAGTEDDLYPTVFIRDSTLIGFIRSK